VCSHLPLVFYSQLGRANLFSSSQTRPRRGHTLCITFIQRQKGKDMHTAWHNPRLRRKQPAITNTLLAANILIIRK
jgi:hypothetical protein